MASINGLKLKNVKTWMGREGKACQGDVYLDNEKICFWSQDGNGGMDTFDFERMYSENSFIEVIKELYKDKPYCYTYGGKECKIDYDVDLLMADIMDLEETEKTFLKFNTKGFKGILVIENDFYQNTIGLDNSHINMTDEQLKANFKIYINQFIQKHGKENIKIEIYRSVKDFDIGIPIKKEQLYDVRKLTEFYKWETIILSDRVISKDAFEHLDTEEQNRLLTLDFIPSKKDYCFYEKNYLLSLEKETEKDIELVER